MRAHDIQNADESVFTHAEAESTRVVDTYGSASANLLDLGYDADATAKSNQGWGKAKASNDLYYAEASGDGQALAIHPTESEQELVLITEPLHTERTLPTAAL